MSRASRTLGASRAIAQMAGSWLATELPPHVLGAQAASRVPLEPVHTAAQRVAARRADIVLDSALTQAFGPGYADRAVLPLTPHGPGVAAGPVSMLRLRGKYTAGSADLSYGDDGPAHRLDVWRRRDLPPGHAAPVLVHIPGGAWAINDKRGQGYLLLAAMARRGWVCVSINYRRSPHHAWPAHIVDVKRAIAWVKANIAEYGGDPDFVAVTGGSAGGHLSALAALTADDPALQPGFEEADTGVRAAVPMYGVFDLTSAEHMHPGMMGFLEDSVLQRSVSTDRSAFEDASPVYRVHAQAPPFFVLHGAGDTVVPPGQSRVFSAALRDAGAPTVLHAELPDAHHMFDVVSGVRAHLVARSAASFLGVVYGDHLAARSDGPAVRTGGH